MQDFLQNYEKYIEIGSNILFVVLSILLFFKTKNIGYLTEVIRKMNNDQKNVTVAQTKGQNFSNLKQVYRLNKVSNVLEPTDDYVDIQELVNSSLETALDRVLDRLMPQATTEDIILDNIDIMEDKLDSMASLINKANEYRQNNGLSDELSIEQVYQKMQEDSQKLQKQLSDYQDQMKKKQEIKTEVLNNEKVQIEEKSEQN